jgi:hypothetical protein
MQTLPDEKMGKHKIEIVRHIGHYLKLKSGNIK